MEGEAARLEQVLKFRSACILDSDTAGEATFRRRTVSKRITFDSSINTESKETVHVIVTDTLHVNGLTEAIGEAK